MTISQQGIDLIKAFEGFRSKAYKPVPTEKYYTIAWGHYGPDVKKDMQVTEEQAQELFRKDVEPIEKTLNSLGINFCQECFDGIISWIYNLGIGKFNASTFKKKILADADDEVITDEMVKWVNAGGKPLTGLKRRRIAEANMFLGKERYYLDEENNIKKK